MAQLYPADGNGSIDEAECDPGEEHSVSYPFPFECQFCEFTYKSLEAYTAHMLQHEVLFKYEHKCRICDRQFICREELALHYRFHRELKPYKCKLCDQDFVLARSFEYHLQSHGGVRLFQCQLCQSSSFLQLHDLHEHLKDHQMGRVAEMGVDEQLVYPELQLTTNDHEGEEEQETVAPVEGGDEEQEEEDDEGGDEVHYVGTTPAYPLKVEARRSVPGLPAEEVAFAKAVNIKKTFCNLCNKKMATRKSLNTHYKTVHMRNIHTCGVCRTSFLFSRLLEAHTRKRKRIIPCEFCDMQFCSNKRWSSHLARHHANPAPSTLSQPISIGYTNSKTIATANLHRQSLLKSSVTRTASPSTPAVMQVSSNNANAAAPASGNAIGKFPCESCGKIFLSLNFLQSHLVKRSNPNFQYQCDVCQHRFSKKVILDEHKLYHERNPKKVPKLVIDKKRVNGFSTPMTGAVTTGAVGPGEVDADTEMDYDRHIIRLSDSSFKCNCCHRMFKAVNHLKCHLRYTHMKKNFKCRSCNQQFPFYKLYLAHMKNSKLCERCDKRICIKFDFKIHTQKCRGTAKLRNSSNHNSSHFKKASPVKKVPKREEQPHEDLLEDQDYDDDVLEVNGKGLNVPQLQSSLLLANNSQAVDEQLMETSEYPSIPHFLMDDFEPEENKCELCGKVFGKLTSLHMHSFVHDPNKEMKCIFCNFLFLQRSSLNRHYRCRNTIHTCQVCKESFCSHVNLRQHACTDSMEQRNYLEASSGGGVASGGVIDQSATLDEDFLMDVDMEGDAKQQPEVLSQLRTRNKSGNATPAMSRLGINSEDVSGRNESIELSDTEPESMTCMMCMQAFNTKTDLDHHVATEHGTMTKCPICYKAFRSPTILQIHMAARASKKNKIECTNCSHRFNKQSEFRKHFLYHTMKANRPNMADEAIYDKIASKYPKGK